MSANLKSENPKVMSTVKIDGGAYRLLKMPDGSLKIEVWGPNGWTEGGASAFAAKLGIPIEDLDEGVERSRTSAKPHLLRAPPIEGRIFTNGGPLFYEFRLFSISVLGNSHYSTVVEQRYDGEMHALSLDFNHAQLEDKKERSLFATSREISVCTRLRGGAGSFRTIVFCQ